jgi:hypothetical protein
VIARGAEEKLFQIPFTLDAEDNVTRSAMRRKSRPLTFQCRKRALQSHGRNCGETLNDFMYDVDVMKAGIGYGSVDGPLGDMPQLYPREVVAEVAQAVNGARFGRRHPVRTRRSRRSAADRRLVQ